MLIAIHSFNKEINNFHRGVEIGLLYNSNLNLLLRMQKKLQEKKIHFGRNYPYSGFFYNYTLDKALQKWIFRKYFNRNKKRFDL